MDVDVDVGLSSPSLCLSVSVFLGATLSDQCASFSALVIECFVMIGINIGNFAVDGQFYSDVRKEYDSLHHKMGIPHARDVPEEEPEEEEEEEEDDSARPAGAGGRDNS